MAIKRGLKHGKWLYIGAAVTLVFLSMLIDGLLIKAAGIQDGLFKVTHQFDRPLKIVVDIAHVFALVTISLTLLKTVNGAVRQELDHIKVRFFKGHIIIAGLDKKSICLIEDCLSDRKASKLDIVVVENDSSHPKIAEFRAKGVIVLQGAPTDAIMLRKARMAHANYLFAMSNDDERNLEIANTVFQMVNGHSQSFVKSDTRGNVAGLLECFVHMHDSKLKELFQGHAIFRGGHDSFNGRLFSVYEATARQVFNRFPPDLSNERSYHRAEGRPAHIVILGFGLMGRSLVLQAIKLAHYGNGMKTIVSVIDPNGLENEKAFRTALAGIDQLIELSFYSIRMDDFNELDAANFENRCPVSALYFCPEGDEDVFVAPVRITGYWDSTETKPMSVVCMPENTGISAVLDVCGSNAGMTTEPSCEFSWLERPSRLRVINMIRECCTWKALVDEEMDAVAKTLHETYCNSLRKEGKYTGQENAREWRYLIEEYRESNRKQADFLTVRKRTILANMPGNSIEKIPIASEFGSGLVEKLARMEHCRWMADKILAGWRYGKERDVKRRLNENLMAWEELPERAKAYNLEEARNILKTLKIAGL